MSNGRKAFLVYVDLDPTPGECHSLESAQEAILFALKVSLSDLEPQVEPAPSNLQPDFRPNRGAFFAYINFYPLPTAPYTTATAVGLIQSTLNRGIRHYNPHVLLAPDFVLPENR